MCGIAGIIHYNKSEKVNESLLTLCRDTLLHRGIDDGANYIHQNVGLAHRRLSIIDLTESGHQPMISEDGNYIVVYNGEIYNYVALREMLLAKGVHFKSSSDTEVLLQMYIHFGKNMLHQLSGMFAFAIWDNIKEELFLARDRVGIKPLHYCEVNNSFAFASEPKALMKAYIPFEIEDERINELLIYRFVAGEKTLYKNLYKLLPGHYLVVNHTGIKEKAQWWNLKTAIENHQPISDPKTWFFNTFNNAVKSHMVSDVPVGVLLSGGLDSSSIAASLNYQGFTDVKTFNVGFKNFIDDETDIAQQVSKQYNFPFYNIKVEDDELLRNTLFAAKMMGESLVHQNEPQLIAISALANQHVKVLLSGEGADEFMGGYVRYKALDYFNHQTFYKNVLSIIPSFAKKNRLLKLEKYLSFKSIDEAIIFNAVNNYPSEFKKIGITNFEINNNYREQILGDAKKLYPNSIKRQAMYLDQHTYLCTLNERNDKTTMSASIECRVPFLDHKLIEGLGTLPDEFLLKGKRGKFILIDSFKNYLPESVTNFRKVGFSVPWMQFIKSNEQFNYMWNTMENSEVMNMGVLKLLDIPSLRNKFNKGDASQENLLRQLFFIALWYDNFKTNFS